VIGTEGGDETDRDGDDRTAERRLRWLRRAAGLAGIVGGLLILAGAVGANVLGAGVTLGAGVAVVGLAVAAVGLSQRRYAGVVVEDSVDRRRLRRGGGVFLVVGGVLLVVGIWLVLP